MNLHELILSPDYTNVLIAYELMKHMEAEDIHAELVAAANYHKRKKEYVTDEWLEEKDMNINALVTIRYRVTYIGDNMVLRCLFSNVPDGSIDGGNRIIVSTAGKVYKRTDEGYFWGWDYTDKLTEYGGQLYKTQKHGFVGVEIPLDEHFKTKLIYELTGVTVES